MILLPDGSVHVEHNEPAQSDLETAAEQYYTGGILTPMAESAVSQNNGLYNQMKSGVWQQKLQSGGGLTTYIGANGDGKLHFKWEQENVEEVRLEAKGMREMFRENCKTTNATDNPIFPGAYPAMHLPKCIANAICMEHFAGRPWELIKMNPEDKWKFYHIVNTFFSDFVTHPSGKIPLPDKSQGLIKTT